MRPAHAAQQLFGLINLFGFEEISVERTIEPGTNPAGIISQVPALPDVERRDYRLLAHSVAAIVFPIAVTVFVPFYAWLLLAGSAIIAQWTVPKVVRRQTTAIYVVCVVFSAILFAVTADAM